MPPAGVLVGSDFDGKRRRHEEARSAADSRHISAHKAGLCRVRDPQRQQLRNAHLARRGPRASSSTPHRSGALRDAVASRGRERALAAAWDTSRLSLPNPLEPTSSQPGLRAAPQSTIDHLSHEQMQGTSHVISATSAPLEPVAPSGCQRVRHVDQLGDATPADSHRGMGGSTERCRGLQLPSATTGTSPERQRRRLIPAAPTPPQRPPTPLRYARGSATPSAEAPGETLWHPLPLGGTISSWGVLTTPFQVPNPQVELTASSLSPVVGGRVDHHHER